MKYKLLQITTLLHLLYEWTCCSLAFAFVEVVFTKQAPHFYLIPVTGVWFVISYILRAKAGNYLVLLVGHLLMRLPIYLLPISGELQWVYFIIPCYLFFASISGVRKKTNESGYSGENELPWPSFLFCLAAYLVGGHLEQPGLQILQRLFCCCCIWQLYTQTEWSIIWTLRAMYQRCRCGRYCP